MVQGFTVQSAASSKCKRPWSSVLPAGGSGTTVRFWPIADICEHPLRPQAEVLMPDNLAQTLSFSMMGSSRTLSPPMYLPNHFEETKDDELFRTIAAYPLGALVMNGPNGLDANHVPFLIDAAGPRKKLLAHVARANPLWKEAQDGDEALVIFRADDAYISPNWYPSKHESHRQVPTWNYRVVHVHGRLYVRDSERFVRGVVARLTR